jgi:transcriptional regulator with XRE-family HTH domain
MSESYPQSGIATRARSRIRGILAERDMTINDLAEQIGWSRSAASRRLGRTTDPLELTLAEIETIASALSVPASSLLITEDVAA